MTESNTRLYLLDVEGTIAPLSLVSEQLLPYARAHFELYLRKNIGDAKVCEDLAMLAAENCAEYDISRPVFSAPRQCDSAAASVAPAIEYLIWLMDRDRKSTALKSLQGKIWKAGFESGELKGTLFADVPPALARWSMDARVAIYSSGSVEAQQLLFRHSIYGDLTPLIAGYFDTRTGPKVASASYAAIALSMGVAPSELLFFSDVVRELDAARDAGCQTRLVAREGNAPVDDSHGHTTIQLL